MGKRDVEADILSRFNRFIEEGCAIPGTPDGKVNVLALCRALGLPAADAQHFHRKESIKTAVSVIGAEQGLAAIGSRTGLDPQEAVLEQRLKLARGQARDDAMAASEASAAMQVLVDELRSAQAEITVLRVENRALLERLQLIEEQGILWDAGGSA
ncbi:hypothetical protein D9599_21310 [Roseomonas sp. KE2513]|nr:hypothetical protein [Roseomonas sp. KE2513]